MLKQVSVIKRAIHGEYIKPWSLLSTYSLFLSRYRTISWMDVKNLCFPGGMKTTCTHFFSQVICLSNLKCEECAWSVRENRSIKLLNQFDTSLFLNDQFDSSHQNGSTVWKVGAQYESNCIKKVKKNQYKTWKSYVSLENILPLKNATNLLRCQSATASEFVQSQINWYVRLEKKKVKWICTIGHKNLMALTHCL